MGERKIDIDNYKGYRELPAFVDLGTPREILQPGLSIDESVDRLKRHHWALRRLHDILTARITAMPIYEIKMAFSLHSHLCAEHVQAMRGRVREMRQPPLGLDTSPHAALDIFFDELLAAPTTEALLLGLYEKAFPALQAGLQRQMADTNRLFDHPSHRICRLASLEMEDIQEYGDQALTCLVSAADREAHADWLVFLDSCLAACGGMDGTEDTVATDLERQFSAQPYVYEPEPVRDERFQDGYNMGVNAEVFLHDESYDALPKSLMLYFKRLREIDVPEMMASIIHQTKDKPWEYYRDMTRQLWDEARHAMMGEAGFISLDIDWTKIPINFTWSLGLNTQLEPLERHAVLYFIERGLMPSKQGKKREWEIAADSGSYYSKVIQDYDWADEVLHVRIGQDWFEPEFKSDAEALEVGGKCWDRVLMDWSSWRKEGLTEHRNWWPEIYTEACAFWKVEPDSRVLAYNETYEAKRADLQEV